MAANVPSFSGTWLTTSRSSGLTPPANFSPTSYLVPSGKTAKSWPPALTTFTSLDVRFSQSTSVSVSAGSTVNERPSERKPIVWPLPRSMRVGVPSEPIMSGLSGSSASSDADPILAISMLYIPDLESLPPTRHS